MSKSFGLVQPSLIQQIKKILDQYPDDGQILKELIQNAEDAGAKEVKFLYDKHSHGTKKLCNPRLAKFQSPALYAYNDAKFTDDDWNGIGMLCNSIKEKDPTKVGRFGLGFKSVFHMTDLPSVISGESVGIIDPEEKYFSDSDGERSGRKWHLRQDRKDIRKNADQFAPYKGIFGCNDETFERGSYEGTLFRLPLRKEVSKLSDTVYSQGKMRGLLECFEKDAHLILLFLMNLERIEVYERDKDCSQPRKLFHVGISADCLHDVRKAREEYSTKVTQNVSSISSGSFREVKKTYPLTIETVHYNNGGVNRTAEHSYVVTLFFSGSDVSREIKALMTNESLSYLPLVGVALSLQPQMRARREKGEDDDDCELLASRASGSGFKRRKQSSGNERKRMKKNAHEPQGHLFCFLPLPLESKSLTGLPVHVNGFFALSQNRRHLKWPSADQDGTLTDKSLLWNKGLLQEVLPKAYAELILHVISCSSRDEQRQKITTSNVYSAWPDINKVDVKWKTLLQPLFDLLLQSKILHTDANGGGWCRVEEVLFDNLNKSDHSREIVIELLNKTGRKVVTVPVHVETALQQYCTLQYVTPKITRSSLKANPSCYAHLDHQDKILLLKFVLSDSDFQDLHGLVLLPLADKTFTAFVGRLDASIYIDSTEHPKSLLPGLQRMFLDTEVDDAVTEQLTRAVKKGYTQLCLFDKEAVKQHLRQSLPSDWQGSEIHVTWYPGISKQLTIEWFRTLWKYFGRHFSPSDLDSFVGLPLVPVTPMSNQSEVHLARIQRPSSLVLASFNGESINESVCHVLKNLGLTILEDLPEYIRYYPGLVSYANPASARGVLNAIRVFIKNPDNKTKLIKTSTKLKPREIYKFREFLANVHQVDSDMKDILRKLPLFERWSGGSQKQDSRFVSLDDVKKAAPTDDSLPSVNVFIDLIDLRTRDSHRLASLLDISPMSKGRLLAIMLKDALEGRYSSEDLDKIVKFIFQHFSIFSKEDATCLREKMKQLPFVALDSKSPRKMPRELFDPEVKILNKIFLDENVFPENNYYAQPEVLIHLRKLGLKGEDGITASDIFKCAKLVRLKKNADKAKTKSFAILKLLEKNLSLLEEKVQHVPLKDCLSSIAWIPFLRKRPEAYHADFPLKHSAKKEYFVCPKDVTSYEFSNLVGSIKYLVDTRDFPNVSEKFGWDKQPSLQDAKSHLENVINVFQKNKRMDELRTKMAFVKIYSYFQQSLKNAEDEVKEVLSPLKFILVQKQLLSAEQVAFSCQVRYPPYLCKLPDEYERFRQLFQALGVREIFEMSDYIKTLEAVKHKYEKKQIAKELKRVTIDVVRLLAEAMEKENVTADEAVKNFGTIFIPDSEEVMRPSTEVCVKDVNDYCTWIEDEGVTYANEDIPPHVCITLGVKTRRQETLRKHMFGLPFGQKEKLTNRLKRILTGYPCDESIMKELLQNADDAKATKVCFIKDPRQHPDERVFEESWKPLQGPALCVYNNAPFTESDIQGIQNLGEGNKGDDPNKTGQYGVGFNAVYHLTDAPTFISKGEEIGEVMCVFDPNLKFVPGADEASPGVMSKDLPALRRKFPDVFPCYDHGRCFPLKDATMFRFPLRNEDMATTSNISKNVMTIKKLNNLLKDFKEELLQVLLFVNNVKEIAICEVERKTGKLIESYRVQSSLSSNDEKKRKDFAAHVRNIGKRLKFGEISVAEIPVHRVSYVVNLQDSKGLKQEWFVVQKIGFEDKEKVPGNIEEAFKKGNLGLLPRGGVASLISSSDHHRKVSGKAFCFLPLPFKTGLPVHINGHFALDHEARRSLWRDDKGSDYRGNWNDALLRQVVAPCYLTLLDEVRQRISSPRNADGKTFIYDDKDKAKMFLSNYMELFPVSMDVRDGYWETLCKEVYHLMNVKALRLLPVLRLGHKGNKNERTVAAVEWLSPTGEGREQAFFDNLVEASEDDTEEVVGSKRKSKEQKNDVLRETLLDVGFNLLYMTMRLYECFRNSSVDVSLITPAEVIRFFGTYSTPNRLCNIANLPLKIKDTEFKSTSNLLSVVKYCKQDKSFSQRLEGLPLLLTENDVLQTFSLSHKIFLSSYYKLLPRCQSMFVHHKLLQSVFHFDDDKDKNLPSSVFKPFDVASFASHLPNEMNQSQYSTSKETYVIWNPNAKTIPNQEWVNHTWKFFTAHIKKRIKDCHNSITAEEKKRLAKEVLGPVKEWCLLPALLPLPNEQLDTSRHVLAPLKLAETVIYLEDDKTLSNSLVIKFSLRKVCLPELSYDVIEESSLLTARGIVARLDDPKSVLSALSHKFKTSAEKFQNLQDVDCSKILSYFRDHQFFLKDSQSVENLKKLPLYKTIHDDITSISGKKAFVLSSRIPKDEMNIWEETGGIVFLVEDKTLESLYEILECHFEDEADIYCDVIFKNFEEMSEKARLKHMAFVRELMKELENVPSYLSDKTIEENKRKLLRLTTTLSQVQFIAAQDGSLETASSFYDPSNEVFKTMFESKQEMFPPKPFCEWEWLSFLRRIGLIHKVSDNQFVQFAKEVETEVRTSSDDGTRKKSEALVTYLFESENITTSMLLDDVKGICFILPHVVHSSLQAIHQQYGPGNTGSPFICFRGSVASKNHDIAWTTANLLPDYANPFYHTNLNLTDQEQKQIAQRLGILPSPTIEMVVAHCKNICNVSFHMSDTENSPRKESKKDSQKVVTVMTNIYKHLERKYDGNEEVINELKDVRCLVVDEGKRFVFPSQVATDITSEQEIPPYLYKMPLKVATYEELFIHLGTTNTVTAAQYSMVLKRIHDESGTKKLHPNEIRHAFQATKGFFEKLDKDVSEIKPLYLPGVNLNSSDLSMSKVSLRTSEEILYNDAPHLKERLRQFNDELILVKLADCGLQVNNEDLVVKKLPESIRPRMLKSVVRETLMDEDVQHVTCSSAAQELRQVLTSSELCHGIIRLIKHADYQSDAETSTDIPPLVEERLRCIRVYSVPNLRTRLVYNDRAIPESEAKVCCFEEKAEEENKRVWKIYIEKDAELSNFDSVMAEIIDRITEHHLKKMIVHLPKLLSSKPQEIKGLLDGLKIREDNSELQIKAAFLPTPGNFIHISDHHLLVDDFTVFSPGEYVGYELDDPSLRGEDETPTYIYAVVIEEVIEEVIEDGQPSNQDPSLRKYRIDIGKDKEPIVVDAADLYKFYRPSQDNSECLELEEFTGTPEAETKPANLDEAKKEIRKILEEAWKLSEEKGKKIIKRLFLKWHPDKNPGNETFCTEVFKFIQQEIQRLEEGLPVKPQSAPKPWKESRYSYSGFYTSFFKCWSDRAKTHKRQSSSFHSSGGFSTWGSSSAHRSNPQPGEARRWYKQAKADLEAASNDVQYQRTSYEWACFKCHQSAEKALKAAQYSIDADKTNVHNLRMIARDLNNATLSTLASELESLVGDSTRMRYPDRLRYPEIPNCVYTSPMASEAIRLAAAIVQEVESNFIN